MKTTLYKILAAILLTLPFSGCNFLEVDVLGKNDIPKFFSDINGVRLAGVGIYSEVYKFYDTEYMKYSEIAADMVSMPTAVTEMRSQYDYTSMSDREKEAQGTIWEKGYSAISNINHLLFYAPQIRKKFPIYAAEIDAIMAEAYFLKAIMHLFICNCYGQPYNFTSDASHMGVPVAKTNLGVNDRIPRESVKDVYAQVINDLNTSLSLFGNNPLKGVYYASPLAVKALQARVYLYMGEWAKARDIATEVINAKPLSKGQTYINMFTRESADETIFRLSGKKNSSHKLRTFYYQGDTRITHSDKFINTFYSDNDIRKQLLEGRVSLKYAYGPDYNTAALEEDLFYAPIVFRTSEMYLIRAEAYCGLKNADGAANDLKEIIGRSQSITPADVTLTYTTVDDLMKVVQRERILELSLEGHRFFDIIRYKQDLERDLTTTAKVQKITYPSNKFVLPITDIERDVNKAIIQNPGY